MPILNRILLCLVFLLAPLLSAQGQGVEPSVERIETRVQAGRLLIDADVAFSLSNTLRDAAERGLPLYITADLVIAHSRWWWFDRTDIDTSITWRIVFNALTRQWRVGVGELSFPVSSLDDALTVVRNIRNWDVGSTSDLAAGVRYEGQLRVRLDNSMLPRPLQVNALNSSAWSVSTPWSEFTFELDAQKQATQ